MCLDCIKCCQQRTWSSGAKGNSVDNDFAKFMGSLGCVNAANFDGGGSVALFYKEKFGNIKTLTGNGRSLSSVIYFTELS